MLRLTYEELEQCLAAWARQNPDLQAGVVIGSRAGVAAHPDTWSDLDTILFLRNRERYTANSDWLAAIAPVWLAHLEALNTGDTEWWVIFKGGLKLDLVLCEAPPGLDSLQDWVDASHYREVLARGIRVLFDSRSNCQEVVPPSPPLPPPLPDEGGCRNEMVAAGFAARKALALLGRGDLWSARTQIECGFRRHLLTMLEWHARAVQGPETDTWHDGRNLADWSDPGAAAMLQASGAAYEAGAMRAAMLRLLALYERLAGEVAARLGYQQAWLECAGFYDWLRQQLVSDGLNDKHTG